MLQKIKQLARLLMPKAPAPVEAPKEDSLPTTSAPVASLLDKQESQTPLQTETLPQTQDTPSEPTKAVSQPSPRKAVVKKRDFNKTTTNKKPRGKKPQTPKVEK